jgi:hypothetical protein
MAVSVYHSLRADLITAANSDLPRANRVSEDTTSYTPEQAQAINAQINLLFSSDAQHVVNGFDARVVAFVKQENYSLKGTIAKVTSWFVENESQETYNYSNSDVAAADASFLAKFLFTPGERFWMNLCWFLSKIAIFGFFYDTYTAATISQVLKRLKQASAEDGNERRAQLIEAFPELRASRVPV